MKDKIVAGTMVIAIINSFLPKHLIADIFTLILLIIGLIVLFQKDNREGE